MSRQDIHTEYGTIHVSSPGPYDKYENVNTIKRQKGGAALPGFVYSENAGDVTLQGPALRSWKQAERRATPRRMRKNGKIKPIILTGIGYRSYDTQRSLWLSDPGRFAHPDSSMHVEALAVDIHSGQSAARRYRIKKALLLEGWHYAVPSEPWHASFTVSG